MIRIGIICPSEIAYRRFMPALKVAGNMEYVGVACANAREWFGESLESTSARQVEEVMKSESEKAENFRVIYGGKVFHGYETMLHSGEIDAVYIPLPPGLHYKWCKLALESGLHVFVEKPSTISLENTEELVNIARKNQLALHENYMFIYHSQIKDVNRVIEDGSIGTVRLIRIDFGFPRRAVNDFRYNKSLGGGALLDCGGYTLKYARELLGESTKLVCASSRIEDEYEVDIFGSATLVNDNKLVVQVAFGMDNDYRCTIDAWGSNGTLRSNRILTAPAGYEPEYSISKNGAVETIKMEADDAFANSMRRFIDCVEDESVREDEYSKLICQEKLVDQFMKAAN